MKYTKEILSNEAAKARSIRQVLLSLGLKESGGNYCHIKKRMEHFGVDTSHFTGLVSTKGVPSVNKHTKESFCAKVLVNQGPGWQSTKIRKKLIEFGLKESKCEKCGLELVWNNKPLSLQLDHINGDRRDNRLINLRILCPNCHSQTSTYCNCKRK